MEALSRYPKSELILGCGIAGFTHNLLLWPQISNCPHRNYAKRRKLAHCGSVCAYLGFFKPRRISSVSDIFRQSHLGYPDKTPPDKTPPAHFGIGGRNTPHVFYRVDITPPATFDRVDKTPLVSFARWIKSPYHADKTPLGQNPPDARLGTSPVVEVCSCYTITYPISVFSLYHV